MSKESFNLMRGLYEASPQKFRHAWEDDFKFMSIFDLLYDNLECLLGRVE